MKNKLVYLLPLLLFSLVGCNQNNNAPTSITVSIENEVLNVEDITTFSWNLNPVDASSEVYTTSDDPSIAIVSNNQIMAVSPGVTKINVISRYQNKGKDVKGSAYIEVVEKEALPIPGIEVTSENGTTLYLNATLPLVAKHRLDNEEASVSWLSSDPSIATVNEDGIVSPIKVGEVRISALSQDNNLIKGSIDISVKEVPDAVTVDFTDLTNDAPYGTTMLSTLEALEILKTKSDGIIRNVTTSKAVYSGNGSSGAPYSGVKGLLKFGAKTEGPGKLVFVTTIKVTKIELIAADWGDLDGTKQEYTDVIVNGDRQLAPYNQYIKTNSEGVEILTTNQEICKDLMTFELATPSTEITIDTAFNEKNTGENARVRFFQIKLYF